MARFLERSFWRGDDATTTTSSMVEAICGYVKRFQALDRDARAWAEGAYAGRQAMADFLFQVNHIEGEGFDTVEETRDAMQRLPEDEQQLLEDERMEQVRCLRQAFRLWWIDEEESSLVNPSIDNFRLRKCHDLLMASTRPDIAGLFRSSNELASTITSRGLQHFYTSPSSIKPKLANLVTKTNLQLQKISKDWTSKTAVEQLLVLATDFFYKFECIHPFVDGNGRCGRIMLAYLLRSITVFPNVLFAAAGGDAGDHGYGFVDRNVYLKCFENAREVDDDEPRDLTALVIEGVYFGWQKFFEEEEQARTREGA